MTASATSKEPRPTTRAACDCLASTGRPRWQQVRFFDGRLSRSQSRHGHAMRRAPYAGQPDGMAETESGSSWCSPLMPSLMPGRGLPPLVILISMNWPTPIWSIEADGFNRVGSRSAQVAPPQRILFYAARLTVASSHCHLSFLDPAAQGKRERFDGDF